MKPRKNKIRVKMRLFMLVFLLGCTQRNETKSTTHKAEVNESNLIVDNSFINFLGDFKKVSLPFSLEIGDPNWIDFSVAESHSSVIPREKVKKYFYGNSDKKLEVSTFDQFYYGNAFLFNENLIGITYYGTSKEENGITGYQLATFEKGGELLSTLLIAGTKGMFDTEMQIEAIIKSEEIILEKIELDIDKIKDFIHFEGLHQLIIYQVNENGSIKKIEETENRIKSLTVNEDRRFRIEILPLR